MKTCPWRSERPLHVEATPTRASCLRFQGRGHWSPASSTHAHALLRNWQFVGGSPHDDQLVVSCNHSSAPLSYAFDFDECRLSPLRVHALCRHMRGWHVVFVGDSIDSHLYTSFTMQLTSAQGSNVGLCGPAAQQAGAVPDPYACAPTRVCEDNTTLRFVREDWLTIPGAPDSNSTPPKNANHVKRTETRGRWLRQSVEAARRSSGGRLLLVLSAGEHPYDTDVLRRHITTLTVLLRQAASELQHAGGRLVVVHRSPISGHPNCELADRPLRSLNVSEEPLAPNFTATPNQTLFLGTLPGPNAETRDYFRYVYTHAMPMHELLCSPMLCRCTRYCASWGTPMST